MDASESNGPRAVAVVVAAGRSTRFAAAGGGGARKPLHELAGRTLLEHSCAALAAAPGTMGIVVVAHPEDVERLEAWRAEREGLRAVVAVVAGGAERLDSVRAGALEAPGEPDVLCVHDAARPLVRPEVVQRAIETAANQGAALVATPVTDTIHRADETGPDEEPASAETLDRSLLWAAQTPQAFRTAPFLELLEQAARDGLAATDDAALWEHYVGPVPIVASDPTNLKITTPDDLRTAEALLAARRPTSER
jgi:2-C-methyl-D-erythritol 4-phosphate cytidylyltransferase